tara:strand:+ start:13 stop:996 length:984 start_codon:yes stop_codon:yes gene_type:complete
MSDIPSLASRKVVVYAVGGNALSDPSAAGLESREKSEAALSGVLEDIVDLLESGHSVVMTHGNGPQVGELLLMEEALLDRRRQSGDIYREPCGLAEWVAATQGTLGLTIAEALENRIHSRGRHESVVSLITRVEVSQDDPAFLSPTKPVGPFIDDLNAIPDHWSVGVSSGDKGPRRVVGSPHPNSILDLEAIESLLSAGAVVLCCGGGGVPVVVGENGVKSIDGVIDKDRVSSLLARSIEADAFILSTAVPCISIGFGTPAQDDLITIDVDSASVHLENGEFPPGSMGPKVEAMIEVKSSLPNCSVVLCMPGKAYDTLRGVEGTTLL